MNAAGYNAVRSRGGWLWLLWLFALALWTLGLLTPYPVQVKQDVLPASAGFPVSKLMHVAVYAALAGSAAFLPPRRWPALLLLSLHGAATEYLQNFVALRSGSWSDVAIDHAGILLGVVLTLPWWLRRR